MTTLVKLISTGVYHTDLHAIQGDWPVQPTLPFAPVTKGSAQWWDPATESLNWPSGSSSGTHGSGRRVGRVSTCWWTSASSRIPPEVDLFEVAPILCAGVTVCKGLMMTGARPGQWVVIQRTIGGAHGVLVTAVHLAAFTQAITTRSLGEINTTFGEMREGTIGGRVVITYPVTNDGG